MWKNAIQYSNEQRPISVTSATELTTFYLENKSRALIGWLSLWRRQRDAMTTVADCSSNSVKEPSCVPTVSQFQRHIETFSEDCHYSMFLNGVFEIRNAMLSSSTSTSILQFLETWLRTKSPWGSQSTVGLFSFVCFMRAQDAACSDADRWISTTLLFKGKE